ncbi:hypothetical protein Tco_0282859 [Tanacetum coccineum]
MWIADVVPEDCIIHLIGEKFVALFHLELEMNHVMMKHFDDFECRAFQVWAQVDSGIYDPSALIITRDACYICSVSSSHIEIIRNQYD